MDQRLRKVNDGSTLVQSPKGTARSSPPFQRRVAINLLPCETNSATVKNGLPRPTVSELKLFTGVRESLAIQTVSLYERGHWPRSTRPCKNRTFPR
jgi:hypothetical protein